MERTQFDRKAFTRGFWRGLGASAVLYARRELPEARTEFIHLPKRASGGLEQDWTNVGNELRRALELTTARG